MRAIIKNTAHTLAQSIDHPELEPIHDRHFRLRGYTLTLNRCENWHAISHILYLRREYGICRIELRDEGKKVFEGVLVAAPGPIDDFASVYRFVFLEESTSESPDKAKLQVAINAIRSKLEYGSFGPIECEEVEYAVAVLETLIGQFPEQENVLPSV